MRYRSRFIFVVSLVAIMLCTAFSYGAENGITYNGYPVIKAYSYLKMDNDRKNLPYMYSNGYFVESPVTDNPHLATVSIILAKQAAGKNDIEMAFSALDYDDMTPYGYDIEPTQDSIAAEIASKRIGDFTLVCVAIRGGGYYAEWAGNFNLGLNGNAAGMGEAAEQVYEWVKEYLEDNHLSNNVKFWLTGYSRGGAASNLVSKELSDKYGKENVFGYTFEAPQIAAITGDNNYPNIKNYRVAGDIVPLLYPGTTGLGQYGQVIKLANSKEESFDQEKEKFKNQFRMIEGSGLEYTDPTMFRDVTIRIDRNTLIRLLKGQGIFSGDENMTSEEFYEKVVELAEETLLESRERYSSEIPDQIRTLAEKIGVQPATAEQVLMVIGNTFLDRDMPDIIDNFSNIRIKISDISPVLKGIRYILTGKGEKYLPQVCNTIWSILNTSRGDYIGVTDDYGEELGQMLKSSIPTIVCSLRELVKGDYYRETQLLSNLIVNWKVLFQGHNENSNYIWVRAQDSYLDEDINLPTGYLDNIETSINGDNLDALELYIYNNDGEAVGHIVSGQIKYICETAIRIGLNRNEQGQLTRITIDTPVNNYGVVISSDEKTEFSVGRNEILYGRKITARPVIDCMGSGKENTQVTLCSGQTAVACALVGRTYLYKQSSDFDIESFSSWYDEYAKALLDRDDCIAWSTGSDVVAHGINCIYNDLCSETVGLSQQSFDTHSLQDGKCCNCGLIFEHEESAESEVGDEPAPDFNLTIKKYGIDVSGISGNAQVQLSGDKDFITSKEIKTVYEDGCYFKDVKPGKTYYVRTRALNGGWGEAKSITIPTEEYVPVTYVEFTGDQIIDTGIEAATWKFDMSWTRTDRVQAMGYDAVDVKYFGINKKGHYYSAAQDKDRKPKERDKLIFSYESSNTAILSFEDDGASYALIWKKPRGLSFTIGGLRDGNCGCYCKIYDVEAYQNSELIAKYVPCYRVTDKAYGLYNTIGKRFYTCKGLIGGDSSGEKINGEIETEIEPEAGAEPDMFQLKVQDGAVINAKDNKPLVCGAGLSLENKNTIVLDGKAYFNYYGLDLDEINDGFSLEYYGSVDAIYDDYAELMGMADGGGFGIDVDAFGYCGGYIFIEDRYIYVGNKKLDLHRNYHLVSSYDGSTLSFYVDGELFDRKKVGTDFRFPPNEAAQYLCIGGDANILGTADLLAVGTVKSANVYSFPLTDGQVLFRYNLNKNS